MKSIVTLTLNPSVDVSSSTTKVSPTRKIRCEEPRYDPGGGGINIAKAIHLLGEKVTAMYPSGGPTGYILDALIENQGFDHRKIRISGWTRQTFAIEEQLTHEQYRFNMPGPSLSSEELERLISMFTDLDFNPAYLIVSGSFPPETTDSLFPQIMAAKTCRNTKLVVDSSGPGLRQAVDTGAFLIKPNRRELEELVGRELKAEHDLEQAAQDIIEKGGVEIIVVSLGAQGALLVTRDLRERFNAPSVKPQSQIGAGDSMLGAIIYQLAQDKTPVEAVRFGVAAGTAAVLTPGTELFRVDDLEQIYPQI